MKDLRLDNAISSSYVSTRRADPGIARHIHAAFGDALKVVSVGAGTGNYETTDRMVVAVDPSLEMIGDDQRPTWNPKCNKACLGSPNSLLTSLPEDRLAWLPTCKRGVGPSPRHLRRLDQLDVGYRFNTAGS